MNIAGVEVASRASGRVFISYSRRDIAFTQRLAERLKSAGYEAYLDLTDIAPGEPWQERLGKLIAQAHTVVFVLSPDSAASPICGWEVEEAERQGKRLLPVAYRRVEDSIVPAPLARLNFIFMDNPEAFEAQVIALLNALETDLTWVREHARLADLANAWEAAGRRSTDTLRGKALEAAERWQSERPAKAPEPTALHRAFLAASRKGATQRQRWAVGGALSVAALATGLGLFAESNRREAEVQRVAAIANERRAVEQERVAEDRRMEAEKRREQAEQSLRNSISAIETTLFNVVQRIQAQRGLPVTLRQEILTGVKNQIETIAKDNPEHWQLSRLSAVIFSMFSETQAQQRQFNSAIKNINNSIDRIEKIISNSPTQQFILYSDLANNYDLRARNYNQLDDLNNAISDSDKSIRVFRENSNRPDVQFIHRFNHLGHMIFRASLALRSGAAEKAIEMIDFALRFGRDLAKENIDNASKDMLMVQFYEADLVYARALFSLNRLVESELKLKRLHDAVGGELTSDIKQSKFRDLFIRIRGLQIDIASKKQDRQIVFQLLVDQLDMTATVAMEDERNHLGIYAALRVVERIFSQYPDLDKEKRREIAQTAVMLIGSLETQNALNEAQKARLTTFREWAK